MKKTFIIYGDENKIQSRAINILTEIILDCTDRLPVLMHHKDFSLKEGNRYIFTGTKENNSCIRKMSEAVLNAPEQYNITVKNDNVIIEGYDEAGVLYGSIDFYNKYITKNELTHDHNTYFKNIFENELPVFSLTSAPDVKKRGLWTWGYVIYDYKGYIDNMARLKMNTLIIWNDYVPYNAKEMIDYAHSSNIRVYWGFPWGWDVGCTGLYLDDLIILGLLFFLYQEGVKDESLFFTLILLLLT